MFIAGNSEGWPRSFRSAMFVALLNISLLTERGGSDRLGAIDISLLWSGALIPSYKNALIKPQPFR
jgi:hypothetical protein